MKEERGVGDFIYYLRKTDKHQFSFIYVVTRGHPKVMLKFVSRNLLTEVIKVLDANEMNG